MLVEGTPGACWMYYQAAKIQSAVLLGGALDARPDGARRPAGGGGGGALASDLPCLCQHR